MFRKSSAVARRDVERCLGRGRSTWEVAIMENSHFMLKIKTDNVAYIINEKTSTSFLLIEAIFENNF